MASLFLFSKEAFLNIFKLCTFSMLILWQLNVYTVKLVVIKGTETFSIQSKILKEKLHVDIFLPKSYFTDKKKIFPIVLITDSEYNFGGVSYIARRLIKNKDIPEVILVGISYNTDYEDFYKKRARDLTPFKHSTKRFPKAGQAELFISFLNTELFNEVKKRYRVNLEDKTLYGHSFGGLFGSYILLKHPQMFQRIISLSPSLWFAKREIFNLKTNSIKSDKMPVFYTAVGGQEPKYFVSDWKRFTHILSKLKVKNKAALFEKENHRSIFGAAFTEGMRYIYSVKAK